MRPSWRIQPDPALLAVVRALEIQIHLQKACFSLVYQPVPRLKTGNSGPKGRVTGIEEYF